MDNAAVAPKRAVIQSQKPTPPDGWEEAQDSLAAESGLAILLVDGPQPPALVVSNNNSICHAFQSSKEHARLCEPFCGRAYERAAEAGAPAPYRCHAGLHCVATPLQNASGGQPLAAIVGRAFLRSHDYRELAERIRSGELSGLLSTDLFRNVMFASQEDIDDLSARLVEAFDGSRPVTRNSFTEVSAKRESDLQAGTQERVADSRVEAGEADSKTRAIISNLTPTRALTAQEGGYYFPPGVTLHEACQMAIPALVEAHGVASVAVMLRNNEAYAPYCLTGQFAENPPRISLKAKDIKLLQAATRGKSIAVPASGRASSKREESVELFPLIVGEEIKGAVVVGDKSLSEEQREAVASFCRDIALPLEVLRLRDELERRMRAATHLQAFVERVNAVEPEEAYAAILRHSAELLQSERGSLLLYDERANELAVKAAMGPRSEVSQNERVTLGEGVAGTVMSDGRPLVMRDIGAVGGSHNPAPSERSYKTKSFISYPITIAGRKVGVLNVTDKAGGGVYDELDLGMLDMIAPQMALALDRAEWHQKATEFQLLSITDPLTGLLNRRYMEERLAEELERSKRHHVPFSFMMVDIDDFKNYNDRHGHQAGDLALEMTAQCLKSALRSADVASRYGGEEFSLLLPQTNLSEARVIAERIRRRVERTQYPHGNTQPLGAVTVSIGLSTFGESVDTPASVIYSADQALYAAKKRGKNCVEALTPLKETDSADDSSDVERDSQ